MTEKRIIDGRTIMKTVEGVITDVSAPVATATITTRGPTERGKSNSYPSLRSARQSRYRIGR